MVFTLCYREGCQACGSLTRLVMSFHITLYDCSSADLEAQLLCQDNGEM